ncbi:MAG: DciA family protein [Candidatus Omnitrophica bacterium]|nr:DciA family protein [Candidatus Omnitrophota bacterium]
MPRSKPDQIKSVVESALAAARDKRDSVEKLCRAWQAVAGKNASGHSSPVRISKSALVVTVDNPVWMHYLHCRKYDIENKLTMLLSPGKRVRVKLRAGEPCDYADKK